MISSDVPATGQILLPSAGNKTSFVQAVIAAVNLLGLNSKVIVGDMSTNVLTRFVSDEFWQMPAIDESRTEEILVGCLDRNVKVVIPSRDAELLFWAQNKILFGRNGIRVLVSNQETVRTCVDKLGFAEFGVKHNLPTISTYANVADCPAAKVVVKNRFGSGSKEVLINCDHGDALSFGSKLSYPIFQPFIHGKEISVDVFRSEDKSVVITSPRTRDLVINGESKVTTVLDDFDLREKFRVIVDALDLQGLAVIQAILRDGEIHLIECNARFGGASTSSIAAGVPLLELALMDAFGSLPKNFHKEFVVKPVTVIRLETEVIRRDNSF